MAVHRKDIEKDMEENKILQFLRDFNKFLEGVPKASIKFFNWVFKTETKIPQKGIDMICEWAAWSVNIMVERKRQETLKSLHEQNSWIDKITAPIRVVKKFYEDPISALGEIINVVKKILNIFIGPFAYIYIFIEQLIIELGKIAVNLSNIMISLPPTPPRADINFNKFQLKISTMAMNSILEDPKNLPAPEKIFPEPIVPFSKEYFKALGEEGKTVYREESPFYKPKEEDLEAPNPLDDLTL